MQLHFKKSATACNYSFGPSWNFPNATAALQIAVKTALLGGFKQTEHNYLQHAKKTDDCSGSTVWSSVANPKTRDSLPLNRGLHNDSFWTGWANAASTLYGELSFDCMGKGFPFLIWKVLIICHFATQAATPVQCYVLDLILPSKAIPIKHDTRPSRRKGMHLCISLQFRRTLLSRTLWYIPWHLVLEGYPFHRKG